jgi:hypothetical protein
MFIFLLCLLAIIAVMLASSTGRRALAIFTVLFGLAVTAFFYGQAQYSASYEAEYKVQANGLTANQQVQADRITKTMPCWTPGKPAYPGDPTYYGNTPLVGQRICGSTERVGVFSSPPPVASGTSSRRAESPVAGDLWDLQR